MHYSGNIRNRMTENDLGFIEQPFSHKKLASIIIYFLKFKQTFINDVSTNLSIVRDAFIFNFPRILF